MLVTRPTSTVCTTSAPITARCHDQVAAIGQCLAGEPLAVAFLLYRAQCDITQPCDGLTQRVGIRGTCMRVHDHTCFHSATLPRAVECPRSNIRAAGNRVGGDLGAYKSLAHVGAGAIISSGAPVPGCGSASRSACSRWWGTGASRHTLGPP